MHVIVYQNQTACGKRDYREGDRLRLSFEGYVRDTGEVEDALYAVATFLYRDDRPNRAIRRPFDRGDLITLLGGPRRLANTYARSEDGFCEVATPWLSTSDRVSFRLELRDAGIRGYQVRVPIPRKRPDAGTHPA